MVYEAVHDGVSGIAWVKQQSFGDQPAHGTVSCMENKRFCRLADECNGGKNKQIVKFVWVAADSRIHVKLSLGASTQLFGAMTAVSGVV